MGKAPLNLNLSALLQGHDHSPPPELEILPSINSSVRDNVEYLSDHQLDEKIQRMQSNVRLMSRLADRGAKYQASLRQLEAERERRKLQRLQKDADECQKPLQSQSLSFSGASHGTGQMPPTPNSCAQSFAECFSKHLADKSGSCSQFFRGVIHNEEKLNETLTSGERQGTMMMSSRPMPFQCPSSLSADRDKDGPPSGDDRGIPSSGYSPLHLEGNLSSRFSKKRASPIQASRDVKCRKVQTVVLLDEEEAQSTHSKQLMHQEDKAAEWTKDTKIYYPSRNDPESVELCGSDMECLNPESPLSSTIMNFYIRYLQRPISPTGKPRCDYHFFNTYFYKKLEEAVSYKRSDRDTVYAKFRRWWKGINIFQKAYVFLPIHAEEHWSLAIICMPAKDEETGPLMLHLDSLGFHASSQIFENVESYLRQEWNYLKQNFPQDVPISGRIWNKLSRRIAREIITVPRQKNDYDCGLFVLYFMERFIEEAPERLKKKDLSMFGRNWFKPEEASELRERIKNLLHEQFASAGLENDGAGSSSSNGDGSPVKSDGECIDTRLCV